MELAEAINDHGGHLDLHKVLLLFVELESEVLTGRYFYKQLHDERSRHHW